jgi:hypothetical protein
MSFLKRAIDLTFALGQGNFGSTAGNAQLLQNLRVNTQIVKAGGASMGTATLQVWGMTLDQMNTFSTLGQRPTTQRKNTITIAAGDSSQQTKPTLFIGNITDAWYDGSQPGSPVFQVLAHVGGFDAVSPAPPTSFQGSVNIADVLSSLAVAAGKTFQNNGVNTQISNPYYTGSVRDQILAAVRDAGCQWNGLDNNVLSIWPSGSNAQGGQVPLLSKSTGMIGYPSFTSQGIIVKSLFNPAIGFGQQVQVQSNDVNGANGMWNVYSLSYNIASRLPRGPWEMSISAARPGFTVVSG